MSPRWLALLPFAIGACSYPDFAFAPRPDAATDSVKTVEDSTAVVEDSNTAEAGDPNDVSPDFDTGIDSSVDASVDSTTDTRMDSTVDSTVKVDSAPDTKPDAPADTSMPKGCAIAHDFCQNFDTAAMVADGWTNSFGAASGTLAFDTTKWVSEAKSLVGTVGTSATTASSMVAKHFTVATSSTVITAEGDLMVDALTYDGPYDIILFKLQRSSDGDGVFLTVGTTGVQLAAQGSSSLRWPVTGVTAGKWFRVKMEAVIHPTAGVARLWIDGTLVQSRTGLSTANADDTARQFLVGVFSYMGSVPFKARFDDVSYDLP